MKASKDMIKTQRSIDSKMSKKKKQLTAADNQPDTNMMTNPPQLVGAVVSPLMDKIKEKKKRLPNVVNTGETRTVQVRYEYADKERAEISQNLAQRQIELTELAEEKKAVMSGFNERQKAKNVDIAKFCRQVRDGYEMRDHQCEVILDFKKKQKRYKDTGTKKIVKTEAFTPGDEQRRFA